jgi:protein O-mannosyl-transferase
MSLFVVLEVYQPALNGPFLFDDQYLPFQSPAMLQAPLHAWLVVNRPFLMATFWLNVRAFGLQPYSFHLFNVLFHLANALLVYAIVRKILQWAGARDWHREASAILAGAIFLLHPVQTESVAYVASRSEALSVLFCYAAFTVFLYRRQEAVSFSTAAAVVLLFGAGCLTKEHVVVLPLLLLLTDYYWNPGFSFQGIRRNWRLYGGMVIAGGACLAFVWHVLRAASTAGFGMRDLPWYQYLYTQGRALWVYLRLFILPVGQNVDWDFPISRGPLQYGAVFGLVGCAALLVMAWIWRRRFPLASYGILTFFLLIAPTSSFIPIRDPLVERRMYLPMLGLVLVVADLVRRWKVRPPVLVAWITAGLLLLAAAAWNRNQVWSSSVALWEDAAAKSPAKMRPWFQLAYANFELGRCHRAMQQYEKVAHLAPVDYSLLVDWALACDCAGRWDLALAKLQQAAQLEKHAHVYALMGMVYGKQGKRAEALAALKQAEAIDPGFGKTYVYRGKLYWDSGEFAAAAEQFRLALRLDANDEQARRGLWLAERRLKVAY